MPQVHNPKISAAAPYVVAGRISLASHLLESTLATRRRVTSLNERETSKLLSVMRKLDKTAKLHETRLDRDMEVYRNKLETLERDMEAYRNRLETLDGKVQQSVGMGEPD
ncbi:hypothetical protein LSH36_103g05030 [Paralvinella palmiformis]|uniref:Uncharacterized protein n=1 Tax=Paralvinella palmiformis TaxID=53620 RepID=A0AAD9JZV6_9ANNE|nr:hypothetical protein LSH36_103g05030 [Paralvinella palmiformis]